MRLGFSFSIPLALIFTVFFLVQSTSGKDWHGITPLISTRNDVEKLLGKPNDLGGYEVGEQFVQFFFSTAECANPMSCECRVGADIVLRIAVSLRSRATLKSLGVSTRGYTKTSDGHLLVYDSYTSNSEGVTYTVYREDDSVTRIDYFPTIRDCIKIQRGAKIEKNKIK